TTHVKVVFSGLPHPSSSNRTARVRWPHSLPPRSLPPCAFPPSAPPRPLWVPLFLSGWALWWGCLGCLLSRSGPLEEALQKMGDYVVPWGATLVLSRSCLGGWARWGACCPVPRWLPCRGWVRF